MADIVLYMIGTVGIGKTEILKHFIGVSTKHPHFFWI